MTVESRTSILIVDDDPLMRDLMQHALHGLGYLKTTAVQSGSAALQHVLGEGGSVDLIILDLNMPDMDGVEFIRKLAEHSFRGSIALVSGSEGRVLEAVGQLIGRLRLKSLGQLRKPVQREQLVALLESLDSPLSASTIRADYRHPWTAAELKLAIEEQQLLLHYQPLVALDTGKVLGVEGLVRWRHPVHGMIPPDHFIPVAEETGVVREITRFVVGEGLRQAATWSTTGCALGIALNVSINDLAALDFPDQVAAQAASAGVDPARITLEVSEHQVIRHLGTALDVLSRLKIKGFRLAIDDFGTGYSSLLQLRDLPFDELKIDRGFVHRSPSTEKLRAICAASIRMAHELKMTVVAEGIENAEEWKLMQQLGCEVGQGFGIAKPMAAEQIPVWCAEAAPAEKPAQSTPR